MNDQPGTGPLRFMLVGVGGRAVRWMLLACLALSALGSSAASGDYLNPDLRARVEKLKALLPDLNEFEIERHELPNFQALNFVIKGFLGEGPAASFKMDPQAKTLGEYLRVKTIAVPESIFKA